MPWSMDQPPDVAKNWTDNEKTRCVRAANAALADGRSDEQAIYACIAAAGKSSSFEAVAADTTLSLRLAVDDAWEAIGPEETLTLADAPPVPTRRYKKRVISAGCYVKASDGIAFEVTPETLGHWVVEFQRMQENGVRVPMPATHRDPGWEKKARAGDPRDNMGWVESLWVDGTDLWMSCQLIGADALIAAKRGDVSLNAPPKFVDGKGRTYHRPITHVALCTDPVVPGLGDFIPLAASLRLEEQATMLEFLQRLGAALGLDPATLTEEAAAMEAIMAAVEAMLARLNDEEGGGEETPAEPAAVPAAAASETPTTPPAAVRKETISREYAGSFSAENAPSPLLVQTVAENREMKIDRLAETHKITAEQAGKLKEKFASQDAISLALSSGSDGSEFEDVLELLGLGRAPVETSDGETGPQLIRLADGRKTETKTESPVVAHARKLREAADARAS